MIRVQKPPRVSAHSSIGVQHQRLIDLIAVHVALVEYVIAVLGNQCIPVIMELRRDTARHETREPAQGVVAQGGVHGPVDLDQVILKVVGVGDEIAVGVAVRG